MLFSPDSVPVLGPEIFPLSFVARVSHVLHMGWPGLTVVVSQSPWPGELVLSASRSGFTSALFWRNTSSHREMEWRLDLFYGRVEVASPGEPFFPLSDGSCHHHCHPLNLKTKASDLSLASGRVWSSSASICSALWFISVFWGRPRGGGGGHSLS